jgi:hypothetical protein
VTRHYRALGTFKIAASVFMINAAPITVHVGNVLPKHSYSRPFSQQNGISGHLKQGVTGYTKQSGKVQVHNDHLRTHVMVGGGNMCTHFEVSHIGSRIIGSECHEMGPRSGAGWGLARAGFILGDPFAFFLML